MSAGWTDYSPALLHAIICHIILFCEGFVGTEMYETLLATNLAQGAD